MKTLKTYSKEFKLDAIELVREQYYSIAEAARNLEVLIRTRAVGLKKLKMTMVMHSEETVS